MKGVQGNIKWSGLIVLLALVFHFSPIMGGIPILCVDDAYFWPDALYYQTPNSSDESQATTSDTSAEESEGDAERLELPESAEPSETTEQAEPVAQPAVVTFTNVQDTVVRAVIKR